MAIKQPNAGGHSKFVVLLFCFVSICLFVCGFFGEVGLVLFVCVFVVLGFLGFLRSFFNLMAFP